MHDVFHRFAEQLADSVNIADLHDALAEAASSLDLPSFAYFFPSPRSGSSAGLISTYPRPWTSHYLQRRYEAVDPVIHQARLHQKTFRWDSEGRDLDLSTPQRRLMDEASEIGIRCGFTIPIHDHGGMFAALTFASDEKRPLFFRLIEQYERALRLVAAVFHAQARDILTAKMNGIALSRREAQCLDLAGEGKSAWDIGQILGISPRTAAFHLDNAKRKYGVRTTTQAAIRFALFKRSNSSR